MSHWRWHLDEVFVKINGEGHYLWRAVDHEGEAHESFVTKRRDKKAALKFLKKSLKRHGRTDQIVTDLMRSYGAALRELGVSDLQETGRWANNRTENSHQPSRRRARAPLVVCRQTTAGQRMLRFRRMRTLQKFASVQNHFNQERALYSRKNFKLKRAAALAEWRVLCVA
jgi:putative transposase